MKNPLLKKRRVFSFENVPVWRQYIYLLLIGFVVTAAFIAISVLSSLISVVNISRIDPMIAIGGGDNE